MFVSKFCLISTYFITTVLVVFIDFMNRLPRSAIHHSELLTDLVVQFDTEVCTEVIRIIPPCHFAINVFPPTMYIES